MITKHHNRNYSSGVPEAAGDRYYGQDLFRDAWYAEDRIGHLLKDLTIAIPFIISGGIVIKGTGDTLNITAGVGYCKYSVTVPDSFAAVPPTTQSQDVEAIRVEWDAQTDMAIGSAVLDGVTVNYVKVQYNEDNGNSRDRAKKAGSYVFEKTPSYTIVVDDTPDTDYDILLNTFTATTGSFTFSGISSQYSSRKIVIDNTDYTMLDTDGYDHIVFDNLSANRAFYLPTLADNQGRTFYIVNLDGSYNVVVTPEGAELINDWNSTFEITEKYGMLKITALSDRWLVTPLNDACIYEVSSETADTGLTVDGTWDDVNGMTLLNGIYGKGILSAEGRQYCRDSSAPAYLLAYFGLGKTSGDNAPNIFGAYDYENRIRTVANGFDSFTLTRRVNCEYESDGSIIYMKTLLASEESPATDHSLYGVTNSPMYIKFIRTY